MRITLIYILLFFTIGCCKRETIGEEYKPVSVDCVLTKNLDSCRSLVVGNWTWLQEQRVDRIQQKTVYLTPQNQGYTLDLKLQNDTARFFKNNLPDSVYTYKVIRLTQISGTNFPEDNDPVLVFYNLDNGLRRFHVPLLICDKYLKLQFQFVRSIEGEQIWKKH